MLVACDFAIAAIAFLVSLRVRFGEAYLTIWSDVLQLPSPFLMAPAFGVLAVAVIALSRSYRPDVRFSFRGEVVDVAKSVVALGMVTMSLLYLLKFEDVSRLSLIWMLSGFGVGALGARAVVRWGAARLYPRRDRRRIVVVGGGETTVEVLARLRRHRHLGVEVVGVVADVAAPDLAEVSWLGAVADLPELLAGDVVDEVFICLDAGDWGKLSDLIGVCEQQGKTVHIPVDVAREISNGRVQSFDGLPILSLLPSPERSLGLAAKRLIDLIGATMLLLALSPVWAVAASAILVSDGSPVLYRQRRGGLNGRPFVMLKLRTMVRGAEELRGSLLHRNERVGPAFKISDDPRVTPVGRFLRRWSLDELPQLWNVLRGEMSLVGPRPQPLEEVAAYDHWHRRRLSMRPGITGLWQVDARHDPNFDAWMERDLEYIARWSLGLDLMVLAKTPRAVVRRHRADTGVG